MRVGELGAMEENTWREVIFVYLCLQVDLSLDSENPEENWNPDTAKYYFSELRGQREAIMSDVTIVKEGWVQKRGKC